MSYQPTSAQMLRMMPKTKFNLTLPFLSVGSVAYGTKTEEERGSKSPLSTYINLAPGVAFAFEIRTQEFTNACSWYTRMIQIYLLVQNVYAVFKTQKYACLNLEFDAITGSAVSLHKQARIFHAVGLHNLFIIFHSQGEAEGHGVALRSTIHGDCTRWSFPAPIFLEFFVLERVSWNINELGHVFLSGRRPSLALEFFATYYNIDLTFIEWNPVTFRLNFFAYSALCLVRRACNALRRVYDIIKERMQAQTFTFYDEQHTINWTAARLRVARSRTRDMNT